MSDLWLVRSPCATIICALAIISAIGNPASAREQRGLRACYGVVSFGQDNPDIRLMQVTLSSKRLPFYQNRTEKTSHCPAEVDSCQLKSFVVPGDLLLTGPAMEDFTCANYISPNARRIRQQFRETIGFVPLSELKEVKTDAPVLSDWFGTWHRSAESTIWIDHYIPGKVKVGGWATYGALDPERMKRGAVNTGELDAIVPSPKGNRIAVGENYDGLEPLGDDRSECRAKLRLFGPYLVVEDNGGCGGNNVTFTGVYMRLKQP